MVEKTTITACSTHSSVCSVDCCVAGEWWNRGANVILEEALSTGGEVNSSDAFTINGRPGDLYPCSSAGVDLSEVIPFGSCSRLAEIKRFVL